MQRKGMIRFCHQMHSNRLDKGFLLESIVELVLVVVVFADTSRIDVEKFDLALMQLIHICSKFMFWGQVPKEALLYTIGVRLHRVYRVRLLESRGNGVQQTMWIGQNR